MRNKNMLICPRCASAVAKYCYHICKDNLSVSWQDVEVFKLLRLIEDLNTKLEQHLRWHEVNLCK